MDLSVMIKLAKHYFMHQKDLHTGVLLWKWFILMYLEKTRYFQSLVEYFNLVFALGKPSEISDITKFTPTCLNKPLFVKIKFLNFFLVEKRSTASRDLFILCGKKLPDFTNFSEEIFKDFIIYI